MKGVKNGKQHISHVNVRCSVLWAACECQTEYKLCDQTTGQCLCPPRATGRKCEQCEPNTWNWNATLGCEVRSAGFWIVLYINFKFINQFTCPFVDVKLSSDLS